MTKQGATAQPDLDEGGTTDQRNIIQRMCAIQSEVGYIGKDSVNAEQHYRFRGIDAFMNALHPLLPKHGVIVAPKVIERASFERDRYRQGQVVGVTRVVELLVEFTFHGIDGTSLTVVAAGEGADVADKATNKAMAGALKYAIMQTFMVPTQEIVDGDAQTPELPSGSQAARAQHIEERETPPRDEIMTKLDEACAVLGQTRAKLTEKWRATNSIGPATKLDDPAAVSDLVLYRFIMSLQPYVANARAQQQQAAPTSTDDVPEPTPDERAAAARQAHAAATCDYRSDDGTEQCVKTPNHDGEHSMWTVKP